MFDGRFDGVFDGRFDGVFDGLRRSFPHYRLAILFVDASHATVMQRAAQRGETSGRVVPEHEIIDSLHRVPMAVSKLAPKVRI